MGRWWWGSARNWGNSLSNECSFVSQHQKPPGRLPVTPHSTTPAGSDTNRQRRAIIINRPWWPRLFNTHNGQCASGTRALIIQGNLEIKLLIILTWCCLIHQLQKLLLQPRRKHEFYIFSNDFLQCVWKMSSLFLSRQVDHYQGQFGFYYATSMDQQYLIQYLKTLLWAFFSLSFSLLFRHCQFSPGFSLPQTQPEAAS